MSANNTGNVRERASSKSRYTVKKHHEKFCPKCGSTDVFWASGLPQLWSVWECRNCGYRGALIIENGELAKKVREEYMRKDTKR